MQGYLVGGLSPNPLAWVVMQEQTDIHLPETTVHEALVFSAQLRLPSNTPSKVLHSFVDEVGGEEWPLSLVPHAAPLCHMP